MSIAASNAGIDAVLQTACEFDLQVGQLEVGDCGLVVPVRAGRFECRSRHAYFLLLSVLFRECPIS